MRFTDEVTLVVRGGAGGAGSSAMRSVSHRHHQPDGGDGGDGGAVYFQGSTGLNNLSFLAASRLVVAQPGAPGRSQRRHGGNGRSTVILVPLGTIVTDLDQNQVVCDVLDRHHRHLIATGGRGGVGNAHAGHRASPYLRLGGCGQYRRIRCELKLLADVGLVGWPNAGKSSLLTAISNQHCRIEPFAFSTLTPNLGIVQTTANSRCIVADLPGLIGGSHTGKGLGINFLRHVERCLVLAIVLDGSLQARPAPLTALSMLIHELNCFNPMLTAKPIVLVLSKSDLPPAPVKIKELERCFSHPVSVIPVSALNRHNLPHLQTVLVQLQSLPSPTKKPLTAQHHHDFNFYLRFGDFIIKKITFNRWLIVFKSQPTLSLTRDSNLNQMLLTINNSVVVGQLRGQGIQSGHQVIIFHHRFLWQHNRLVKAS